MKITVGNAATSAGNIEMTVTPGKTVNFDRAKFNDLFQKSYRSDTVSYVVFRAPSETEYPSSVGTFYRGLRHQLFRHIHPQCPGRPPLLL